MKHGSKSNLGNLFEQIEIDPVVATPCVQDLLDELGIVHKS